jgi:hypothetical protein
MDTIESLLLENETLKQENAALLVKHSSLKPGIKTVDSGCRLTLPNA